MATDWLKIPDMLSQWTAYQDAWRNNRISRGYTIPVLVEQSGIGKKIILDSLLFFHFSFNIFQKPLKCNGDTLMENEKNYKLSKIITFISK